MPALLTVLIAKGCAVNSALDSLSLRQDAVVATNLNVGLFALAPDGYVYGARGGELRKITRQGSSTDLMHRFDDRIKGIHFTQSGGVLISTDNDHWSPTEPCRVYFAKSLDDSFKHVFTLQESSALWWSLASDKTGNLYIGEYGPKQKGLSEQVWRSTDQGESWQSIFRAPNKKDVHIHRVAVDPVNDDVWITHGDGKDNRGVHRSSNSGRSWKMIRSSQATAVGFTNDSIIWGEDHRKGRVTRLARDGLSARRLFQANKYGPYGGSIYDLVVGGNNKLYVPLMKYPDQGHHASVWVISGTNRKLLVDYGPTSGLGSGSETIAGPDLDGWIYVKGYKIKDSRVVVR